MVTITDRMGAWRRERQVLARVSRAAWRLEQAGRERSRALASARAEEVSIRTLAAAAGLSPPGVPDHGRRGPGRAGRRALARSRRPGGDDDAELDGRDLICRRLVDKVGWLRQCVGWLTGLHAKEFPPVVNLRPEGDNPDRAHVVVDLPGVAAIVQRIGAHTAHLPGCVLSRVATSKRVSPPTRASPPTRPHWQGRWSSLMRTCSDTKAGLCRSASELRPSTRL